MAQRVKDLAFPPAMGWGGARGLLVSLGPNHVLAGVEAGGKGDGGGRRGGGGWEGGKTR